MIGTALAALFVVSLFSMAPLARAEELSRTVPAPSCGQTNPCTATIGPCTLKVWAPWHSVGGFGNDLIRYKIAMSCTTGVSVMHVEAYLDRFNCIMFSRGITCSEQTVLGNGVITGCNDPIYGTDGSCELSPSGGWDYVEQFGLYDPVDNPTVCHGWQTQGDGWYVQNGTRHDFSVRRSRLFYWGPNTYDPC